MTGTQHEADSSGMLAQILLRQGEMSTQLAVISEQLKAVPDHEGRIRTMEAEIPPHLDERLHALETARARLLGAALVLSLAASTGGTWIGLVITRH